MVDMIMFVNYLDPRIVKPELVFHHDGHKSFLFVFSRPSLCCCGGNISSPVKYSYLTIFPDDSADIFFLAANLLMSYCNFHI